MKRKKVPFLNVPVIVKEGGRVSVTWFCMKCLEDFKGGIPYNPQSQTLECHDCMLIRVTGAQLKLLPENLTYLEAREPS